MAKYHAHIMVVVEIDDEELAPEELALSVIDDGAVRIKQQMGAVTNVYTPRNVMRGEPDFGL